MRRGGELLLVEKQWRGYEWLRQYDLDSLLLQFYGDRITDLPKSLHRYHY